MPDGHVLRALELRDLEGRLVGPVALVVSVCAWLAWWYLAAVPWAETGLALVLMAQAGLGLVAWRMCGRRPFPATALLTVSTLASLFVLLRRFDLQAAAYFFVVPVWLAGTLLRPWTAPATALAACGALYLCAPAGWPALVLLVLIAAARSLFERVQMRSVLDDAWNHSMQAAALAAEAYRRRGEVNQLNEALKVANGLLARQNAELAGARREAEEARRIKEQFAIHVSHELRTPLNIILGFLQVMQRFPEVYGDVHWTPTLRQDLADVQASARHLSDLVDDILDLARIEAMKMPIRREESSLEEIVLEASGLAGRLVRDKPVAIRVDIHESLPRLYIDRTRIRQVLLNLLANATRYTEHGEICVSAHQEGEEVVVSVADTGVGIAPEQLSSLFSEFRQLEIGSPRQMAGKGLGLAIAKRFIDLHGGRIWANSEVGHGSEFCFALPVQPKQVGLLYPVTLPPERPTGERTRLLVIDGDGAAAYLHRRLEDCEITSVADLPAALPAIEAQHPRAVILNSPPDTNGATHGTPPPIIANGAALMQCSLPAGSWLVDRDLFDDWLVKPIDSGRLLEAISRHCPRGTLLVVDDDEVFAQLVRRIVQAEGGDYQVQWASTAEEALARIDAQPVDLLLLDMALPDGSGRSVAQSVRNSRRHSAIPIVAVTAAMADPEGAYAKPCTFSVTRASGFSEAELFGLIEAVLKLVGSRYGSEELRAAASPEDPCAPSAS